MKRVLSISFVAVVAFLTLAAPAWAQGGGGNSGIHFSNAFGAAVTIIGAVGSGNDPDLLTLTRGQSERWLSELDAWSVAAARRGDRWTTRRSCGMRRQSSGRSTGCR